jgi:NitT/TauT family transport system permease protein
VKGTERGTVFVNSWRLAIIATILIIWQWGYGLKLHLGWIVPEVLDPYFVSTPSEIWHRFLRLGCFIDRRGVSVLTQPELFGACLWSGGNNLWMATLVTLKNTFWGFGVGVVTGVILGLALGQSALLARICEPFIVGVNSIPRIAVVPLIILMFGFGDMSKIVTAWLIVFIVVFFNTFEGARAVDRDHIAAARLLGATQWQLMKTVIVPSTMAWVFASLTPAISFSLIGVIVAEFIGANFGLGRLIVEAEARAESADMMVAIFVMMVVGVLLTLVIRQVQRYLLRWQPHFYEP